MGRTCWIAGMVMAAKLATGNDASAQTVDPLMLEVLVCDHVGVPAEALRQAQDETSRIFESSGIRLVWVAGQMPNGRHLILQITSRAPSRKSRNPDMLGVAARTPDADGIIAWVFYNRIDSHRRLFHMEASLLLGHVMAHEMGHLLLPYGSHTPHGLMKESWDKTQAALAAAGALTFSPEEAGKIRDRLSPAHEMMATR